jgi:hypothetical protein
MEFMQSWQNQVTWEIIPKWKEHAEQMNAEALARMRGFLSAAGTKTLLLSATASEEAFETAQREEFEKKELRDKILRGAAGVSGSAAAGYLAWTGMRMFGPKRRRV